ncbi:hypothetical protein SAMN05880501_102250 [Ureibacillus xyleni]|uniref:Uncharacterized protein n=1 Tax=Ureibacillus xyleni TaxID=614648 RepID=A0A285RYL3_9BACL|nr:hypothetical protein [Ureibacillus xyleni]SOB99672.1 hypothetical protein SAMN05880501_102250 [Ureibacillus xyleni]
MMQLFLLLLEVIYLFLAFKSGNSFFFVVAIILGGWWLYELNKESRKRNEAIEKETIDQIEEYPHTRYILSPDYLQALLIDENSDTFRILDREELDDEFEAREYDFQELFEVAIVEDGKNVALTSKGGVHGWSLIDGGSKLDVNIGGSEESEEKSKKEVKKLLLKLVVDDLSNPIVEYTFLDNEQAIPKDLDEYKDIFKECNNWYQKVSIIIKRYEHERKEVTVNAWT